MTESPATYPDYKPSGVSWIGHVPTHWEVRRIKADVSDVVDLTNHRKRNESYVALEHVESWTGRIIESESDPTFENQVKRFRPGDVLFGKLRPYLAKVTHAQRHGVCVGEFLVLRPHHATVDPSYLTRLIRSKPAIGAIDASTFGAKMPRADWQFIGSMLVPIPPLDEQSTIVRYLDRADELINRYISAKERLIALLDEQRQAVIHQAVTRGLDPNAPSKKSGIEWLDDVPQHWQLPELKQVSNILRGKFTHRPRNDPSLYGGIYPFIQTGDVAAANGIIRTHRQTLNQQGLAVSTMFPAGTLVMTIAANIGDVAVLNFEACFPDSIVGFVPTNKVERDFLYYLFRAMKSEFLREAPVNTQGNLNVERIGSKKIPLPSVDEQVTIVRHLAEVTAHIDAGIELAHRQVGLIGEYRTRLIADIVTGQIDVRNATVQLPGQHL